MDTGSHWDSDESLQSLKDCYIAYVQYSIVNKSSMRFASFVCTRNARETFLRSSHCSPVSCWSILELTLMLDNISVAIPTYNLIPKLSYQTTNERTLGLHQPRSLEGAGWTMVMAQPNLAIRGFKRRRRRGQDGWGCDVVVALERILRTKGDEILVRTLSASRSLHNSSRSADEAIQQSSWSPERNDRRSRFHRKASGSFVFVAEQFTSLGATRRSSKMPRLW